MKGHCHWNIRNATDTIWYQTLSNKLYGKNKIIRSYIIVVYQESYLHIYSKHADQANRACKKNFNAVMEEFHWILIIRTFPLIYLVNKLKQRYQLDKPVDRKQEHSINTSNVKNVRIFSDIRNRTFGPDSSFVITKTNFENALHLRSQNR